MSEGLRLQCVAADKQILYAVDALYALIRVRHAYGLALQAEGEVNPAPWNFVHFTPDVNEFANLYMAKIVEVCANGCPPLTSGGTTPHDRNVWVENERFF